MVRIFLDIGDRDGDVIRAELDQTGRLQQQERAAAVGRIVRNGYFRAVGKGVECLVFRCIERHR